MVETKQKSLRIGGYGATSEADGTQASTATPKPPSTSGGGGSTTPRGGSTTPRGANTPRGGQRAAGLPITPTKAVNPDGVKKGFSIFFNDDIPAEEFDDFLNNMDKLPKEPQDGAKPFKSLEEALTEKFDINEFTSMSQRLKNVPNQSHRVKDLIPAPLYLLTKR